MSRKIKLYLAIAGISMIQGLQMTLNPVLQSIQNYYTDIDVSLIQMLVTIPAFVSIASALLSGWLVIKVSKKKMLLFAAVLALVSGLIPFINDNFYLLFAMRALFGIALGIAANLNAAVVSEFFEGDERVTAMGVQAASVGAGYLIVQYVSGWIGASNFKNAYYISFLAVISFIILFFFLPDTGKAKAKAGQKEKVALSFGIVPVCAFGFIIMMCIITFSTNIAMHLGGDLAGDTSFSGTLLAVFSFAQILAGIFLGQITKLTKKYVLAAAMLCFTVGGLILAFSSDNRVLLIIAALFIGLAQGAFIPSSFVDVSYAVAPIAVALASAVLTASQNIGQTVSPYVLNNLSKLFFHEAEASTGHVYLIAAILALVFGILCIIYKTFQKGNKKA